MKKIVVTGALGHIGSALIRKLPTSFQECEIVMIDNFLVQRYSSLFNLPKEGRYRFIEKDVSLGLITEEISGADAVIHLAAITNATESYDMKEYLENHNFSGTQYVAQSCAMAKIPLIFISTSSVYSTRRAVADETCEGDDLSPQSPYAITKIREENLLRNLSKSVELKFITMRFGTIFGVSPGMRFHTAVNKFCWQAVTKQPVSVWSTALDQVRPYLDLNDALDSIEFILKRNIFDGEIYNVLTDNFSVRKIVDTIRIYYPDIKVQLIDSKAMNSLSFRVLSEKFCELGFQFSGDLNSQIKNTITLLAQSQSACR